MSKKEVFYSIDGMKLSDGYLEVNGWMAERDKSEGIIRMFCDDREINEEIKRIPRKDVAQELFNLPAGLKYGFSLRTPYKKSSKYVLEFSGSKGSKRISLNRALIWFNHNKRYVLDILNAIHSKSHRLLISSDINYDDFRRLYIQQNKPKYPVSELQTSSSPVFSIVIPLYETPEKYLRELIGSIEKQTYKKYEVCFADGSPEEGLKKIIEEYQAGNYRIRYRYLRENRGISGNTNAALEMATGDFIVLCDHDDLLTEDALYELAAAVKENPECDCIYSDEDKVDENTEKYFEPHFKPDYNIDLLCSENYICHLYAVRKSVVEKTGGFRSEYDGAQDHDFILRTTERSRQTVHIAKVLYHWRTHTGSTSENPESKMYAFEAGKKAVRAHYERVWPEIEIEKIEDGASLGIYHTYFKVKEELISVIIPNKDHVEDLDKAVRSLIERGTWKNLEFIIVENNSEEEKTFEYYEKIEKEYPQVKVVRYEGGFNYSRINNFGVKYAKGKYILLMNNDVELINPDSLKEMAGYCQREDVGIVGCRLLYDDDTIQHAGVIVGVQGIADHAFKEKPLNQVTYFNRAMTAMDLSAVTAAVMMIRKEVYEEAGGLDEDFEVAFNDIDFCLRVRETGRLVVYNPYACFHHYESKSRGMEDTIEKQRRFRSEIVRFVRRHEKFLKDGDPMYNPNLSLIKNDYSLRNLYFDRIGKPFFSQVEFEQFRKESKEL